MKKVEIKQFTHAEVDAPEETFGFLKIPIEHKLIRAEGENLEVSDGYHSFDELYEHRITLFIALCKAFYCDPQYQTGQKAEIWRSRLHSDGSSFEGWFILGIGARKGQQITYHLPISKWDETKFAYTWDRAPEFDGHTSADVLERLKRL
jgi:hypothetical protein